MNDRLPVDERTLLKAVDDALYWLEKHPKRDYLDAAYAMVADPKHRSDFGSAFSTSNWPVFIEAVKNSLAKPEPAAHNNSALKEDNID